MQVALPAKSLRAYLPRGQTLPDDVFARRHLWMQRLLLAHVVGIPLFGLSQGFGVAHSLIESAPIAVFALASRLSTNRRACAGLAAAGMLTSSAVLVHLWHGAIEAHFHFFVVIPLLALYEDWIPFLIAVAYVGLHHGIAGAVDPGVVYNHRSAIEHPWRWAGIHGLFVAAAGAVSLVTWRLNEEVREQTRIESSRRADAEAVSAALQRGLRPERLPEIAEGTVAGRYLPAGTRDIGGDWYDVVPLPDGRVALTLGDVAGHGVAAASQMAGLRHAVRAYAYEGMSPQQVASRIDRLFQGEYATFLYLVFDPGTAELRFANAGHLPPLVVGPDGEAGFLFERLSSPLGLGDDAHFEEGVVRFAPGTTVLAYTDGLVERRTEPIDRQLERLRLAVSGTGFGADSACERALAAFPPDGEDDVALLAFQAAPVTHDAFQVPPHPIALAGARERLRGWLARAGVGSGVAGDLILVADEAITNAIVHSGSERGAEVELARIDGRVEITVRDFGRWSSEASDPDHGRGLMLMKALTDHVDVTHTDDGTTVTLARRVEASPTAPLV
ncbi:MAG TPA: SpoIIE family protein phosphatase [Thermoleophilaceae bacterium]|jgi:anti-sigma regulatory factor (Ser/Thr protein kinase)